MDCPICFWPIDSADQLVGHLKDSHSFSASDAGRIAKHMRYWMEYDAVPAQDGPPNRHGDTLIAAYKRGE